MAANESTTSMLEGCKDIDAKPDDLERPYLKRKAPGSSGNAKMGLPAMTSFRYLCSLASKEAVLFFFSVYFLRKSQPLIDKRSTCFIIFAAFRQRPSAKTKQAPPLKELVSTRGKSLFPATSNLSVLSPVTQIGHEVTIVSISSALGTY